LVNVISDLESTAVSIQPTPLVLTYPFIHNGSTFNHCLSSIARKVEKSEVAKLAKRITWAWIIVWGGPDR
jgi:hypothetical protein